MDAATESLVIDAIRRLMRGRTTLVIAHRLSTIRHADRIVVLDRGRVSTIGSIEELGGTAGIAEVFRNTRERDRGVEK